MSREVAERLRAGASFERSEAERRRNGPVIVGAFRFELNLSPGERMALAGHLADSASMARSGYLTGQVEPRTAAVVAMVEAIAGAVSQPGPAAIPVELNAEQCRRVRSFLRSSQERAGDIRGVGEAIAVLVAAWEKLTRFDADAVAAEQARPARVAADTGGWIDF